ncbi:nitroreductase, partial [Chloroflexota bacterium]
MDIDKAIRTRRSIRSYKADPVPQKVLAEIMETSSWAASGMNVQPWEFAIIGGEKMKEYKALLDKKVAANAPPELEFPSRFELPEPFSSRAAQYRETSMGYQFPPGTEGVEEKKRAYFTRAGRVYDAPNAIIVYMEKELIDMPWQFVSIGMIAQTICLAALDHGLGTCIMGRPVAWPNMVRELLGIPANKSIALA